MVARDRSFYTHQGSGTIQRDGFPPTNATYQFGLQRCEDEVSPGDGHNLTVTKHTRSGACVATGKIHDNWTVDNYYLGAARGTTYPQHLGSLGIPSDAELASELLARTNPSRANVDIPVFIGELWDLPDLVRKAGGSLLRRIAAGNLKYQFGIRPLVSDLLDMLNFVDLTDKRMRELKALQASGIRRTRTLYKNGQYDSGNRTTQSSPTALRTWHAYTTVTVVTVRGHVKWFPTGDFPTTDAKIRSLARKAVLGLTLDGATAWELIPFSWLADWFSNIGSLMQAGRNIVPATPSTPQIMVHTVTESKLRKTYESSKYPLYGDYTETLETKTRRSSPASFDAHLPLLSLRQLSILGSLAVLKSGRYH